MIEFVWNSLWLIILINLWVIASFQVWITIFFSRLFRLLLDRLRCANTIQRLLAHGAHHTDWNWRFLFIAKQQPEIDSEDQKNPAAVWIAGCTVLPVQHVRNNLSSIVLSFMYQKPQATCTPLLSPVVSWSCDQAAALPPGLQEMDGFSKVCAFWRLIMYCMQLMQYQSFRRTGQSSWYKSI